MDVFVPDSMTSLFNVRNSSIITITDMILYNSNISFLLRYFINLNPSVYILFQRPLLSFVSFPPKIPCGGRYGYSVESPVFVRQKFCEGITSSLSQRDASGQSFFYMYKSR